MILDRNRKTFYKFYTPSAGCVISDKIAVFYYGIPLYSQAEYRNDRYVFGLPLNLEDRLLNGDLDARFAFAETGIPAAGKSRSKTPVSLILRDRYR